MCYFATEDCQGELWTCKTCGEQFCQYHWHQTDKGTNVECAACACNREDYERDYQTEAASNS